MLPSTLPIQFGSTASAEDFSIEKISEQNGKSIFKGSTTNAGATFRHDHTMVVQHYPGQPGQRDSHVVTLTNDVFDLTSNTLRNTSKVKVILEDSNRELGSLVSLLTRLDTSVISDSDFVDKVVNSHY